MLTKYDNFILRQKTIINKYNRHFNFFGHFLIDEFNYFLKNKNLNQIFKDFLNNSANYPELFV